MFGILNLDKPSGITSRAVVDRVQRIVRPAKAGHAGTLDPLARGVLIVCVGPATRLIEYVQRMPKRYAGTFLLGRHSDTEDVEGEVIELADPPRPTREQIVETLPQFIGQIDQRPPVYSALKIKGRRAYDLARKGKPIEPASRRITVYDIQLISCDYPKLELDISCGGGTYVRSLGRDIAEHLGTAAVMSALTRTAIGDFHVDKASDPGELTQESLQQRLLSPLRAVDAIAKVELSEEEIREIAAGRTIENRLEEDFEEIAAIDSAGRLVAILAPRDRTKLGPVRNFPRSVD